jgi:hypothetical protein
MGGRVMAHFAKVSPQGIVEEVVVISNDDLLDENGIERRVCSTWIYLFRGTPRI